MNADLLAGRRAIDRGEWSTAVKQLEAGLAEDPQSANDHAFLAYGLAKLGVFWRARVESDEALRLAPTSYEVLWTRSDILRMCNDLSGARAAADRLVEHHPSNAGAHAHRAFTLVTTGRPRAGIIAAETALRINPNDIEALNARSLGMLRLRRVEEAETGMRDALRMRPNQPNLQNNMGLVQGFQGQAGDARRSFEEALRLSPNLDAAQTNLAQTRRGLTPVIRMVLARRRRGRLRFQRASPWLQAIVLIAAAAAGLVWQGGITLTLLLGWLALTGLVDRRAPTLMHRVGLVLERIDAPIRTYIALGLYLVVASGLLSQIPTEDLFFGLAAGYFVPDALGAAWWVERWLGTAAIVAGVTSFVVISIAARSGVFVPLSLAERLGGFIVVSVPSIALVSAAIGVVNRAFMQRRALG